MHQNWGGGGGVSPRTYVSVAVNTPDPGAGKLGSFTWKNYWISSERRRVRKTRLLPLDTRHKKSCLTLFIPYQYFTQNMFSLSHKGRNVILPGKCDTLTLQRISFILYTPYIIYSEFLNALP